MSDLSEMKKPVVYKAKHDASINIMRRILQSSGAEVIHLGHNRSVGEIV